jgi:hypothetical protein
MKNYLLNSISSFPKGQKSLASQIGYCFVILLVILIIMSMSISQAYTSILKQDRSDALMSAAAVSAISAAHVPLQEGMTYPCPIPTYRRGQDVIPYTVNIYTKAGNSFLLVFSSHPTMDEKEQTTLEGAGAAYQSVFNEQKVVVSTRSDKEGSYVAGVAPVMSVDGTVAGILEVVMPTSDFAFTDNGISLSWVFTIISIAVALCMVYYEIHKLLQTVFSKPDRQLPKIIRYGLSGCQSIAFFSTMACTMPPMVIASYVFSHATSDQNKTVTTLLVILAESVFAIGFFGFRSLRVIMVRSLTTRVALIVSVFVAFILLIASSVFNNTIVYIALLMPIGFFLGMLFYFQREYRIYAGRLGYDDFKNHKILSTQYMGFLLGACVGAVVSGMLFERFGLLAVSLVCGVILLIVGIQALLFVQHCPPSPSSDLSLPAFLYALSSARSGSFLWSTIVTIGVQISFFFLFVPKFIVSLQLSIATVAFYYILFFFVGSVLVKAVLTLLPGYLHSKAKVVISSSCQTIGLILLAFFPTAKILVATVAFFAVAMAMYDFHQLEQYKEMLREDKHKMARAILESSIALGGVIGTLIFGFTFLFEEKTIPLLILTLIYALILFAYPFYLLLFSQNQSKGSKNANLKGSTESEYPFQSDAPALSSDSVAVNSPLPYKMDPVRNDMNSYMEQQEEDIKIYQPGSGAFKRFQQPEFEDRGEPYDDPYYPYPIPPDQENARGGKSQ